MTTDDELLALLDMQIRGTVDDRLPTASTPSWDGPILRVTAPHRGSVFARDLGDLPGDELDALVLRARDFFAGRGEAVEWKTYSHDRADLVPRLTAAGFVAEDTETVMVGLAGDLTGAGADPEGVTIRATTSSADLTAIAALEAEVWGGDFSWLADDLRERLDADSGNLVVLVATAGGEVVSAAWLVIAQGTEFGSLWGGSTLKAWRRRGIYRALVAHRASIAVARDVKYLMVDASDDSLPILERLGMHAVTTTTPYVWKP